MREWRRQRPGASPLPLWSGPAPGCGGAPPGPCQQERRLRSAPQVRRLIGVLAMLLVLALADLLWAPPGALLWLALGLLGLLLWQGVLLRHWEVRFDTIGLSLHRPLLRREGHLWRELTGLEREDPLSLTLHFADGSRLQIPNHIEGREELLHIAEHWIASARGSPPHAGTARS